MARGDSARDVWIDIEKPFWWDLPLWISEGVADSIGIAHNHLWRDGGLDNEAWGRPRDRDRFPGLPGNAQWTQEIYHRLLDAGVTLPPSAGSASGVLPNPIGYNRVYVHLEGRTEFDHRAWWEGLRAGRSFVTNGPLLRVRTEDGRLPGSTLDFSGESGEISLACDVDGLDPLAKLEVVFRGRVVASLDPEGRAMLRGERLAFDVDGPGWFVVRAISDLDHTYRFAMTAPFYITRNGRTLDSDPEAGAFFLQWSRERRRMLDQVDGHSAEKQEALRTLWDGAVAFWRARAEASGEATP